MNRFEYTRPRSLAEAHASLKEHEGAMLRGGGVDLIDLMQEGTIAPSRLVNLRGVAALGGTHVDDKGARLGATTTLAALAADTSLRARFAAVAEAAGSAATPQIRNIATVGGNLLQRPRCWYFRSADFQCLKKGGNVCFAKDGDNRYHAIFGGGPSYIVHPSTMATALAAFGASVHLAAPSGATREVPLDKFFVLPRDDYEKENVLAAGEVLTEISVPSWATHSAYLAVKERQVYDWPLAECAVALRLRGGIVDEARVVLGAVAPVPWHVSLGKSLVGAKLTPASAAAAGTAATADAKPLAGNLYKVPLVEELVSRTLLAAAGIKS